MKPFTFALVFCALALTAQVTPDPTLVDLSKVKLDVSNLLTQHLTDQNTIIALQAQIAAGTPANPWSPVDAACPTCRAVILNVIGSQTNLSGVQICCGINTVPPTPTALPPGYALIVISPSTGN